MTDLSTHSDVSSHPPELRRRADHLAALARSIEGSLVMTLADAMPENPPLDRRSLLSDALLQRNLHQLHRAADDLRVTAMRFRARADEIDIASRVAA